MGFIHLLKLVNDLITYSIYPMLFGQDSENPDQTAPIRSGLIRVYIILSINHYHFHPLSHWRKDSKELYEKKNVMMELRFLIFRQIHFIFTALCLLSWL